MCGCHFIFFFFFGLDKSGVDAWPGACECRCGCVCMGGGKQHLSVNLYTFTLLISTSVQINIWAMIKFIFSQDWAQLGC